MGFTALWECILESQGRKTEMRITVILVIIHYNVAFNVTINASCLVFLIGRATQPLGRYILINSLYLRTPRQGMGL